VARSSMMMQFLMIFLSRNKIRCKVTTSNIPPTPSKFNI